MNREDIRNDIRRSVRDTNSDPSFQRWLNSDLNDRINIAQEKIVQLVGCLETRITENLVKDTTEYALPNICLKVLEVIYKNSSNDWIPLTKTTDKELDMYNPDWRTENSGTPIRYLLRKNLVIIYPASNTSIDNGFKIDILKRPSELTQDSQVPFDNLYQFYPFHDTIILEVARHCLADEGKTDLSMIKLAELNKRLQEFRGQVSDQFEDARITNVYEVYRKKPRRTR